MPNARKKKKKSAAKQAFWEPSGTSRAACSGCGFQVEPERAVETGWNRTEYIAVRYRYCPMCGAMMHVHKPAGEEAGI